MSRVWFQLVIVALGLFCAFTTVSANTVLLEQKVTEQEQIKQQISKLIQKLDSNQRLVRQQAELQLAALGKPVLSLLPPPELVSSNSAREALKRVRVKIEQQAASDSLKASRITLTGKHSLEQILNAISKQTGNQLDSSKLPEKILNNEIQIDFVKTTFWPAIDDLTHKLPLAYQINGSNGYLQLQPATETPPLQSKQERQIYYDGPFRIEVAGIERRALIGNAGRELLRATFQIQAEPRLRPLFLSYFASEIRAKSDRSLTLPPFNPDAKYELPLGEGGKDLKFTMQWMMDNRQPLESIQIQGDLKMELAAETLPITFDQLSNSQGAVRRRGNVSVELLEAETIKLASTQNLNVRIALSYDYGGPAFESHRTWIYHNRAYLQSPQGKKYWLNGSSQTTLESAGKIGVLYRFTDLPQKQTDYQFTYLAPTLITSAPIQFQFQNLKVPAEVNTSN
ncbi:hypothetical protein [uncultured Gimesia sp.]|uniref:hypothetical protein n=1 Tax=uncultured Gimesia sp. TaxID=1678688 RepID=UPI0030DA5534